MDLHEEAGKENEEATSKDEIEIYVFVPLLSCLAI